MEGGRDGDRKTKQLAIAIAIAITTTIAIAITIAITMAQVSCKNSWLWAPRPWVYSIRTGT